MDEMKQREKKITETGIIGVIANLILASLKAIIGLLSGAVSIILDAINNLTDSISSIVTIIGIKLSKKAPTKKHPFGFGRIEYFSTIIISAIILATGITSGYEAIQRIIHPSKVSFSWITITVVASAIFIKVFLGLFTRNRGKKYNSESLVASGMDALMDALISVATLIGIATYLIWKVNLDGYIGLLIGIFICKAGIEMLLESISDVIGNRPDSSITLAIKKDITEIPSVLGAYDLILHNYGPDRAIGSVHIEISSEMSAEEIHILTMNIQEMIIKKYSVFLTVGIYAVLSEELDHYEIIKDIVKNTEHTLGCHGFYLNHEKNFISFDVLVDFTVKDKMAFIEQMKKKVEKEFPDYTISINLDLNYSD